MSQSSAAPRRGGRYRRTSGGLTGALLVTVAAVTAFVGFRALVTPDRDTPVRVVDWEAQVRAGRADGKLLLAAPAALPDGWRATSAAYLTGSDPTWQLGLLTGQERYVGVYERLTPVEDVVQDVVDENAEQGADVRLAGETWQVWTDAGGDYAVARELAEPGGRTGALVVVGSAAEGQVRELAGSLELGGR